MSGLSELGNVINARIQAVADYKTSSIPVEHGYIMNGGALQVESLDNAIPKSDYIVLCGLVSDGDEVIVVWAQDDPVVIGVVGGGGGGTSDDITNSYIVCDVPQTASERITSTDAFGNAIYDIGFTDVLED